MIRPLRLDPEKLEDVFRDNTTWDIGTLQVVIYVASGGGLIGRMYACQPADAYRDTRAGRAPYTAKAVENMRVTLCTVARARGLDPHALPEMPDFHACRVF